MLFNVLVKTGFINTLDDMDEITFFLIAFDVLNDYIFSTFLLMKITCFEGPSFNESY